MEGQVAPDTLGYCSIADLLHLDDANTSSETDSDLGNSQLEQQLAVVVETVVASHLAGTLPRSPSPGFAAYVVNRNSNNVQHGLENDGAEDVSVAEVSRDQRASDQHGLVHDGTEDVSVAEASRDQRASDQHRLVHDGTEDVSVAEASRDQRASYQHGLVQHDEVTLTMGQADGISVSTVSDSRALVGASSGLGCQPGRSEGEDVSMNHQLETGSDSNSPDQQGSSQGRGRPPGRHAARPLVMDYGQPDDVEEVDEGHLFHVDMAFVHGMIIEQVGHNPPAHQAVTVPLAIIGQDMFVQTPLAEPGGEHVTSDIDVIAGRDQSRDISTTVSLHVFREQDTAVGHLTGTNSPVQQLTTVPHLYNSNTTDRPVEVTVSISPVEELLRQSISEAEAVETLSMNMREQAQSMEDAGRTQASSNSGVCTTDPTETYRGLPAVTNDDTTAESLETMSLSGLLDEVRPLTHANTDHAEGIEPFSIAFPGANQPASRQGDNPDSARSRQEADVSEKPGNNSKTDASADSSYDDILDEQEMLASAENDFVILPTRDAASPVMVPAERTKQDADSLLEQVIKGKCDQTLGPNSVSLQGASQTCSLDHLLCSDSAGKGSDIGNIGSLACDTDPSGDDGGVVDGHGTLSSRAEAVSAEESKGDTGDSINGMYCDVSENSCHGDTSCPHWPTMVATSLTASQANTSGHALVTSSDQEWSTQSNGRNSHLDTHATHAHTDQCHWGGLPAPVGHVRHQRIPTEPDTRIDSVVNSTPLTGQHTDTQTETEACDIPSEVHSPQDLHHSNVLGLSLPDLCSPRARDSLPARSCPHASEFPSGVECPGEGCEAMSLCELPETADMTARCGTDNKLMARDDTEVTSSGAVFEIDPEKTPANGTYRGTNVVESPNQTDATIDTNRNMSYSPTRCSTSTKDIISHRENASARTKGIISTRENINTSGKRNHSPRENGSSYSKGMISPRENGSSYSKGMISPRENGSSYSKGMISPRENGSSYSKGMISPRENGSSYNKGMISPRENGSSYSKGMISPRENGSSYSKGMISPRENGSSYNKGMISPRENGSSYNKGMISPRENGSTYSKGMISPRENGSSYSKGMISPRENGSSYSKGMISPRENGSSYNKGMISPRENGSTYSKGMISPRENGSTYNKGMISTEENRGTYNKGMISPRENGSTYSKGMISPRENGSTYNKGMISTEENGSTYNKGMISPRENGSTYSKGMISPRENGSTYSKDMISTEENGSTYNKGMISPRENGSTYSKGMISPRENGSTYSKGMISTEENGSTSGKDTISPRENGSTYGKGMITCPSLAEIIGSQEHLTSNDAQSCNQMVPSPRQEFLDTQNSHHSLSPVNVESTAGTLLALPRKDQSTNRTVSSLPKFPSDVQRIPTSTSARHRSGLGSWLVSPDANSGQRQVSVTACGPQANVFEPETLDQLTWSGVPGSASIRTSSAAPPHDTEDLHDPATDRTRSPVATGSSRQQSSSRVEESPDKVFTGTLLEVQMDDSTPTQESGDAGTCSSRTSHISCNCCSDVAMMSGDVQDNVEIVSGDVPDSTEMMPGDVSHNVEMVSGDVPDSTEMMPGYVSHNVEMVSGDVLDSTEMMPGDVSHNVEMMSGPVQDSIENMPGDVMMSGHVPDNVEMMSGDVPDNVERMPGDVSDNVEMVSCFTVKKSGVTSCGSTTYIEAETSDKTYDGHMMSHHTHCCDGVPSAGERCRYNNTNVVEGPRTESNTQTTCCKDTNHAGHQVVDNNKQSRCDLNTHLSLEQCPVGNTGLRDWLEYLIIQSLQTQNVKSDQSEVRACGEHSEQQDRIGVEHRQTTACPDIDTHLGDRCQGIRASSAGSQRSYRVVRDVFSPWETDDDCRSSDIDSQIGDDEEEPGEETQINIRASPRGQVSMESQSAEQVGIEDDVVMTASGQNCVMHSTDGQGQFARNPITGLHSISKCQDQQYAEINSPVKEAAPAQEANTDNVDLHSDREERDPCCGIPSGVGDTTGTDRTLEPTLPMVEDVIPAEVGAHTVVSERTPAADGEGWCPSLGRGFAACVQSDCNVTAASAVVTCSPRQFEREMNKENMTSTEENLAERMRESSKEQEVVTRDNVATTDTSSSWCQDKAADCVHQLARDYFSLTQLQLNGCQVGETGPHLLVHQTNPGSSGRLTTPIHPVWSSAAGNTLDTIDKMVSLCGFISGEVEEFGARQATGNLRMTGNDVAETRSGSIITGSSSVDLNTELASSGGWQLPPSTPGLALKCETLDLQQSVIMPSVGPCQAQTERLARQDQCLTAQVILEATDKWLSRITDICKSPDFLTSTSNSQQLHALAAQCKSEILAISHSPHFPDQGDVPSRASTPGSRRRRGHTLGAGSQTEDCPEMFEMMGLPQDTSASQRLLTCKNVFTPRPPSRGCRNPFTSLRLRSAKFKTAGSGPAMAMTASAGVQAESLVSPNCQTLTPRTTAAVCVESGTSLPQDKAYVSCSNLISNDTTEKPGDVPDSMDNLPSHQYDEEVKDVVGGAALINDRGNKRVEDGDTTGYSYQKSELPESGPRNSGGGKLFKRRLASSQQRHKSEPEADVTGSSWSRDKSLDGAESRPRSDCRTPYTSAVQTPATTSFECISDETDSGDRTTTPAMSTPLVFSRAHTHTDRNGGPRSRPTIQSKYSGPHHATIARKQDIPRSKQPQITATTTKSTATTTKTTATTKTTHGKCMKMTTPPVLTSTRDLCGKPPAATTSTRGRCPTLAPAATTPAKEETPGQDSAAKHINRGKIEPLKVKAVGRPKPCKGTTMQEFERIQQNRHLSEAFARINSSKACVDCHMDSRYLDKHGPSLRRRRERVNYNCLIALENIKFLEMLRYQKSAYRRDGQLQDFKKNYRKMLEMGKYADQWPELGLLDCSLQDRTGSDSARCQFQLSPGHV